MKEDIFYKMNKGDLHSRSLRVFCHVARYGNFSQAARMMGVSPAYITKHIKALEGELDTLLFHRSTRHISLTEQGEQIHEISLQILENIEYLHDKVAQHKKTPAGLIKIATSFGFGRQMVTPALADFSMQYPNIKIQLEVLDQLVGLAQERYDLDIRIGDLIDPNHMVRPLARNHRILCAAPNYLKRKGVPTKLEDLKQHNCLIIRERDHPVGIWSLSYNGKISNIKVDGTLTTNNGEVALAWALAGHGIVLRSLWDVDKHLRTGDIINILPQAKQTANIWAVYPQRLKNSAKIKACVDHLEHYFSQHIPQDL